MASIRWIYAVPCAGLVCVGFGSKLLLGASTAQLSPDGRIVAPTSGSFEKRMGRHIYGPSWLPPGGKPSPDGPMQGDHRILQAFLEPDGTPMCIVSQEEWTKRREAYLERTFEARADGHATVADKPAFFSRGSFGERRLFWNAGDTAVIVSSSLLPDDQILRIARSVR